MEAVEEGGRSVLRVTVTDPILGKKLELDADTLVAGRRGRPSPGQPGDRPLFKVSLSPDDFFQEAHVKLRPVDFAADGVYLCGTAHYPKHLSETISQAYGAAGRVADPALARHRRRLRLGLRGDRRSDCVACGACISVCSYGAIEFRDTPQGKKAEVNPVLCKGDGLCNAKCPTGAISLKHYTDEEMVAEIDAVVGGLEDADRRTRASAFRSA